MELAVCAFHFLDLPKTDHVSIFRSTYWPDCDYWSHSRDVSGRPTFKLIRRFNSNCVLTI
jgi:hypothetical protein